MSDDKKRKAKKKNPKKGNNDTNPTTKANIKAEKYNTTQKLTHSVEEAQKGMLDMVSYWRQGFAS